MAKKIITFWRDIPAQVTVKKGRRDLVKIELNERFAVAIDQAAMKSGAGSTDDYLAEWRRADPIEVSDDLQAEADKAAAELEAAFPQDRLVSLAKNGGKEPA